MNVECELEDFNLGVAMNGVTFPGVITGLLASAVLDAARATADRPAFDLPSVDIHGLATTVEAVSSPRRSAARPDFAALRQRIIDSGLPLLNDEELRAEIRERRGGRQEE